MYIKRQFRQKRQTELSYKNSFLFHFLFLSFLHSVFISEALNLRVIIHSILRFVYFHFAHQYVSKVQMPTWTSFRFIRIVFKRTYVTMFYLFWYFCINDWFKLILNWYVSGFFSIDCFINPRSNRQVHIKNLSNLI